MFLSMILYGIPPSYFYLYNVDYEIAKKYFEKNVPQIYELFKKEVCFMTEANFKGYIYGFDVIIQIFLAYFFAIILGFRVLKKINSLKSSMSNASLKARKQFVTALMVQMAMPCIFIVIPITFLIIGIALDIDIGGIIFYTS